jgi:hypothetical protein
MSDDAASLFTVKTSHYLIAGMSLTAALAWNNTIRQSIEKKFPLPGENVSANILYSIVVTLVLILMIHCLPETKSELPAEVRHRINLLELSQYKKQIHQELTAAEHKISILEDHLSRLASSNKQ